MLDGEVTDENLQPIDGAAVRELLSEFVNVFGLCWDIHTGIIRLTLHEYQSLPKYVADVWRVFAEVIEQKRNKK